MVYRALFSVKLLLFSEEPYRIPEAISSLPERLEREHGCSVVRLHSWFLASCRQALIKAKAILGLQRSPSIPLVSSSETGILIEVNAYTGEDLVSMMKILVEEGSMLGLKSDLKM